MRLILFDLDTPKRRNFYPIALSRPIWEMRVGMSSLAEKMIKKLGATDVAYFLPAYLAATYKARASGAKVNDKAALAGDDLLLLSGRLKAAGITVAKTGPSEVGTAEDGEILYARINKADIGKVSGATIEQFLASAAKAIGTVKSATPAWDYTWDLILANPHQITDDFKELGRSGIEGTIEEPSGLRGSKKDVFVGKGAVIHPMAVIDAAEGPVYLDEGVEVHPFSRIEGPCYIGKNSILLGAKCREGNSVGPMCRLGGEIEESIIQGYSNKYHDGFLGHAYVGEWVNLGALTTNSDLKNDYSSVSVMLDGKKGTDTGSTKVGSLIGDHTKTSIGTLLNTGSYVGAMCLIMATGKPLPKYVPSFSWFLEGVVTKGFGRNKLFDTAKIAMSRRKQTFDQNQLDLYNHIFELTKPERMEAVKKGRKVMLGK